MRNRLLKKFFIPVVILALIGALGCGGEEDDYSPYVDITVEARKEDSQAPLVSADVVLQTAGSGTLSKKTDSSGKAIFYGVDTGNRKVHVTIQGSDDDPYYGQWLNIDFTATPSLKFYVPRIAP